MNKILLFLTIPILLLSGCHIIKDQDTLNPNRSGPKDITEVSDVTGKLLNSKNKPAIGVTVVFAQVYRQNKKAAFVLDSGNSPSAQTDKKGNFTFSNIPTGEYILVIGNPMSKYQIYSQTSEEPEVFMVEPETELELGSIKIPLNK